MTERNNSLARFLGRIIREERSGQGLRLVDLSMLSGVALATLSDLENGARDTRLSSYQRVLDALDLDLDRLFQQSPSEARPAQDQEDPDDSYDLSGAL